MSETSNIYEIDFGKIYRDYFCQNLGISSEQLEEIEKSLQHLYGSISEIWEAIRCIITPCYESIVQCIEQIQSGLNKLERKRLYRHIHPPYKVGSINGLLLDKRMYIKRYRNAIRGGL